MAVLLLLLMLPFLVLAIKDKRMKGTWDSIHILDVAKVEEGEQVSFCYKITSTILLSMLAAAEEQLLDMMNISGNLTRCVSKHGDCRLIRIEMPDADCRSF